MSAWCSVRDIEMKWAVLILFMLSSGCDLLPGPVDRGDYRGHVAATMAIYTAMGSAVVKVDPKPGPKPVVHSRSKCPTGGWVRMPDGNRVRCGSCDPPWDDDGDSPSETPVELPPPAPSDLPPETPVELPEPKPANEQRQPATGMRSSSGSCSGPLCRIRGRASSRRGR